MEPEQERRLRAQLERKGDQLAREVEQAEAPERVIRARERSFLLAYAGFLAVALVLGLLASAMHTFPGDVALARELQRIDDPLFVTAMVVASIPGYVAPSLTISALLLALLLVAQRRLEALFLAAAAGTDAVVWVIKLAVGRPRPTADLVTIFRAASEGSFPSGHVVHYVVFYGFLFYLIYTHMRRSRARTALLVLLALAIVLVGPSRVYLGAHWPSDVVGAYLVGALLLAPLVWAYSVARNRRQRPEAAGRGRGSDAS